MKKILSTLFLVTTLFFANATHNAGGEITMEQLSYLNYKGTINTYTVSSSNPADRDSLEICWGDGICEWIHRDTSFLIGKNKKHNIYSGTHAYATEGLYDVYMTDPNRTVGLVNLFPSGNVPFHIQTKIVVSEITNSTPIFLNPPIDIGYVGSQFQHNGAAIDWEGDSLVYELQVPFQGLNTLASGYSLPNGNMLNTPGNINIHREFGTIIWDAPSMEGDYLFSMKIIEFRGDQIISETTRDFDFTVINSTNPNPEIDVPLDFITLDIGDTLTFETIGSDPDNGEILIQAFGLPFLLDNPASYPAPLIFEDAPITTSFFWEIFQNHTSIDPYYLVFRIEERDPINCGLTSYHVLKINILGTPTNIENFEEKNIVEVFPNPITNDFLNINFNVEEKLENSKIQVFSLEGKLLFEKENLNDDQIQSINFKNFPKGNYVLLIQSDGQIFSKKIIKN